MDRVNLSRSDSGPSPGEFRPPGALISAPRTVGTSLPRPNRGRGVGGDQVELQTSEGGRCGSSPEALFC
jgi:hypothetical protein